jgi:hypothetical protein
VIPAGSIGASETSRCSPLYASTWMILTTTSCPRNTWLADMLSALASGPGSPPRAVSTIERATWGSMTKSSNAMICTVRPGLSRVPTAGLSHANHPRRAVLLEHGWLGTPFVSAGQGFGAGPVAFGWPVIEVMGTHLELVNDPDAVAAAILDTIGPR